MGNLEEPNAVRGYENPRQIYYIFHPLSDIVTGRTGNAENTLWVCSKFRVGDAEFADRRAGWIWARNNIIGS
jgi:hypothetical protein